MGVGLISPCACTRRLPNTRVTHLNHPSQASELSWHQSHCHALPALAFTIQWKQAQAFACGFHVVTIVFDVRAVGNAVIQAEGNAPLAISIGKTGQTLTPKALP